ncbi:amidase signature domain-containing protein [Lasiosphaeris hirsuta]|uniref:Amidase signature domain-containing protein n=1 Tax=Lasiosphaeris hirsuta TaxID=260670 RepID=A0AA40DLT0_9PEZI|nr:amidase signature domain-containing protein [Lasiosphaeris hirsuta]
MSHFNVLTTSATELQQLLASNKTTSVQIITAYLSQIEAHNSKVNAFISIAPHDILLRIATSLDNERAQGRVRGPLHGIPIVLKDAFITASELGMGTTAGSRALIGAKASKNSAIAQRLVDAGLIILGKTNMTEFAGMKMTMMMPGWSAAGGQTLSPYVGRIEEGETLLGHSAPGGSSTGSAVAVAAGFSPLAMGTETIGSIITPASRAALYALKPTTGLQDATGLYTLTDSFDSPGPMAKSAADVMALTEIVLGQSYPRQGFGTWEGLSAGFLDPAVWKADEGICRQHEGTAKQMRDDYESAIAKIRDRGCSVRHPIELAAVSDLVVDGEAAIMPIACNICIPSFLGAFDECPVGNLKDIVKFNEENKSECLPPPYTEQNDLLKALYNNDDNEEHISTLRAGLKAVARNMVDTALERENVDMIAAPSDSPLCIHAAAAGYPIATVPLGQLRYNKRPFGLCLMARAGDDEKLLRFMAAYEASVSGPRPVPDL